MVHGLKRILKSKIILLPPIKEKWPKLDLETLGPLYDGNPSTCGYLRCKIKTAPSPPLISSLLQVCEQLMTMHLAGRRSAAGKPSPGKSHLLRHSQLAAGVPDAIVSHTKGHADVAGKIQRYKRTNATGLGRAPHLKITKWPPPLPFSRRQARLS